MGRRKTGLTQKELEELLKHPHRLLYAIGVSLMFLCGVFISIDGMILPYAIGIIIGVILIILGIICSISIAASDNSPTTSRFSAPITQSKPNTINYTYEKYIPLKGYDLTDENKKVILALASEDTDFTVTTYGNNEHKYIYRIKSINIFKESRTAKITISKDEEYRTVERYVQRDYVKYPVYSAPKHKYSETVKSLKLNADVLEGLQQHNDELIRKLSTHIIIHLNTPALTPSWFLNYFLNKWLRDNESNFREAEQSAKKQIASYETSTKQAIARENEKLTALEKPYNKTVNKYTKAKDKNKEKKTAKLRTRLDEYDKYKASILDNIADLNKQLEDNISRYKEQTEQIQAVYSNTLSKLSTLLKYVTPLSAEFKQTNDFLPLKDVQYAERTKIVGCYIIRNTKNDKCYVGQSKDIRRRLGQHFKGTVPNNPIFAEDYYTSPAEIRETLYEVKIIPLETKDEMDAKEKELIEKYQAFENGYNGTAGNN